MSNDGNKSTKRVPFTMFSSSAEGGYLDDLHANFTDGVTLANMHTDTYGDFRNPPMQGPFTEKHVGGMPHRHTKIILAGDLEFITANIDEAEGYWDETPVYVTPLDIPPVGADTVWELDGSGDLTPLTSPTSNTIWELVDADTAITPGEPDSDDYWRVYKTDCKPEGYYIIPAAGKLNLYAPDFRSDVPRSWLYRDEFAKRPLNIRNIKTEERCNGVGNFTKEYEVVQIAGRTLNPRHYAEHPEQYTTNYALNYGTEGKVFNNLTGALNTPATGTLAEYAMPDNTGSLNNFVFVNRFSAPGDRYTMSRGFLNPKGEELSAYNASPFRNLNVRKELSEDLATHTPKATDIPPSSSTKYHTTNRNTRLQKVLSGSSSDVVIDKLTYDDGYATHAIPRSTLQYSWITASAETTRSEFPGFATGSDIQFYSNSVGFSSPMNNVYIDPDAGTQSFDFTGSVYTYGTWKEIRGGELALSRYYRNHNILPVANVKDEVSQYIEPPVVARNFPLEFVVAIDKTGAPYRIRSSYGSLLQRYSNEEVNKLAGIKTSDKDTRYSQIKQLYLDKSVADANNPIKAFYSLTYGQTLYPKDENTFMGKVRLRGKYTEVPGTGSNGYDRLYGTQNTMYSSTTMRDATAKNSQGIVDVSLAFDPMRTDGINSFPDSGSYSGNVGELNLDTDKALSSTVAPTASLDFFETNFMTVDNTSTDYNERLVEQMSGKKRWYDSYEDYVENARGVMKEASILPEFRISEHMEKYTNDLAGNFRAANKNFLSLLGAEYSSSAPDATDITFDADFEETYLTSDKLASLDKIKKDHIGYAKPNKITLKASGVKKLLPYNGFYPDTRTVQLGNLMSSSLANSLRFSENGYSSCGLDKALASPGILYNSMKSGIAVPWSYFTSSVACAATEDNLFVDYRVEDKISGKMPFETLVNLNHNLPSNKPIFNIYSPSERQLADNTKPYEDYFIWNGNKTPNFELATHNFLAESVEFFIEKSQLNSFISEQESSFLDVQAGKKYTMEVVLRDTAGMNRIGEYGGKKLSFPIDDINSLNAESSGKTKTITWPTPSGTGYGTIVGAYGHSVDICSTSDETVFYSIVGHPFYEDEELGTIGAAYVYKQYYDVVAAETVVEQVVKLTGSQTSDGYGSFLGSDVAILSASDGIHFCVGEPRFERGYPTSPVAGRDYPSSSFGGVRALKYDGAILTELVQGATPAGNPIGLWPSSGSSLYTSSSIGGVPIINFGHEMGASVSIASGSAGTYITSLSSCRYEGTASVATGGTAVLNLSQSSLCTLQYKKPGGTAYSNLVTMTAYENSASLPNQVDRGQVLWDNMDSPSYLSYGTKKISSNVLIFTTPSSAEYLSHVIGDPAIEASSNTYGKALYGAVNVSSYTGGSSAPPPGGTYSNVSVTSTATSSLPTHILGTSVDSKWYPREGAADGAQILAVGKFLSLAATSDDRASVELTAVTAAGLGAWGSLMEIEAEMSDEYQGGFAASVALGGADVLAPTVAIGIPLALNTSSSSTPTEPAGAFRYIELTSSNNGSSWDTTGNGDKTYFSKENTEGFSLSAFGNYRFGYAAALAQSACTSSAGDLYKTLLPSNGFTTFNFGKANYIRTALADHNFKMHGSLFGPAIDSYKDPGYCAYTNPGFYGESTVTLDFSSSVGGQVTLDEVLSSVVSTEYLDVSDSVCSVSGNLLQLTDNQDSSKNSVSDSINLFSKRLLPEMEFQVQEGGKISTPLSARKTNTSPSWVIQTKQEFPVINTSSSLYSQHYTSHISNYEEDLGLYDGTGALAPYFKPPRSPWTSYATPLETDSGYDFELRESKNKTAEDGSLIELCGFTAGTKKVGTVADKKTISEAIMVIPYVDRKIPFKTVEIEKGKHFIRFSKTELKRQKKNVEDKGYAISEDNPTTSISEMISGMKNYVIPPQYNFLQYDDMKPFAAYFLEFDHELSQRDLIDIWQGVMPTIATNPETDEVEITHNFDAHNFFHNMEFPTDIKFMVFKVKKKANWNYYSITADSTDDTRFKFDFQGDGKVEVVPDYNYNWPYDYCSLVDRAKVDVSVTFEKDEKEEVQ